ELARVASAERRILLTRDRALLKRAVVTHGLFVRATDPRRQIEEVLDRLDLYRAIRPFQRCVGCNGRLAAVTREQVWDRLPPRTRLYVEAFWACGTCGQLYWEGSHFPALRQFVESLQARADGAIPPVGLPGASPSTTGR
ncbi:MAG: Mut7-C RNAse domain-containing protein, partial [Candidatus Competibacteraceae bacterium]|nr:Mut7-C RNAse domain-containing protein [Candidatus Competibacteraceae bacterium]